MRYWKPKKIAGNPLVGIAVATWLDNTACRRLKQLTGLVNAFRCQTYDHWMMEVTHDGPLVTNDLSRDVYALHEPGKVEVVCTTERKKQFGHPNRQDAIERLLSTGCEWIGLTNDDNYYVPVYLEWMLAEAQAKQADFVYCDCVHSHKTWKPLPALPKRGHIDLGSFLVRKSLVEKIKFDKFTFAGDWDYISRLLAASKRFAHVAGTLFVHN